MKLPSFSTGPESPSRNRRALQGGSYSIAAAAVILAILVVVNLLVSALPTSMTKYDISSAKLYSVTSNTKAVLSGLDEDVTIYWIVQAGMEDDILENLLGKRACPTTSRWRRRIPMSIPPLPSSTPARLYRTTA